MLWMYLSLSLEIKLIQLRCMYLKRNAVFYDFLEEYPTTNELWTNLSLSLEFELILLRCMYPKRNAVFFKGISHYIMSEFSSKSMLFKHIPLIELG